MVPSFKNTALIFLEILFIQHFTIFSCKQYEIIIDLICILEKRQDEFVGFLFLIKNINRKYQIILAKLKQNMFMSKYLKQYL